MKTACTLSVLLALSASVAAFASRAGTCKWLLEQIPEGVFALELVKERSNGSRIFRVQSRSERIFYFKEMPADPSYNSLVFDDGEIAGLASAAAQSFGLSAYVAHAQPVFDPAILYSTKGAVLNVRSGTLQSGAIDLVTPLDEFYQLSPQREPSPLDIQNILNQEPWPRLYADWKIFWTIFRQVDLSISNLARSGNDIFIFDLGDALNVHSVRRYMGIHKTLHNFHFNLPDRPELRIEHRPDFRKADEAFKNFARLVATESDESLAKRFGRNLDDTFIWPRNQLRHHIHDMKEAARWIVELLERDPFSY